MFNLFAKKPKGNILKLKIEGMHCTSCSLNIDGALEELDGIFKSSTSYAKSETKVDYDPAKINQAKIIEAIKSTGYSAQVQ